MKFNTKSITIGGDKYGIKELSAKQRHEMYLYFKKDGSDPVAAQAHYIKMSCTQFKDKSINEIFDMPGSVFAKLAEEIMSVSGLGEDDDKEAEKNS